MNCFDDTIIQQQIIGTYLASFKVQLNSNLELYPPDLQKMLNYIHGHLFDSDLTIENVKKYCCITNNNVVSSFRNNVGLKPREYIIMKRLKASASILKNENINIYILALSIGYTEEAFSRLFKKTFGMSPLNYRHSFLREMDKRNDQEILARENIKRKG